jgi:phage tail-like protein
MSAFDLIKADPLIATNFFLEIDGAVITNVTSVDGLTLEIEKADVLQRQTDGAFVQHTTMSKNKFTGELTIKRLAPLDATSDELWKWFMAIRTSGMSVAARAGERKSGSVVIYDTTMTEISRWNFTEAWPSKIASDSVDVSKNEPISETITLQYETLIRKK